MGAATIEKPVVDYHSRPEISRSMLALFAESPRKYQARYITRSVSADEETDAMKIGTGTHAIALKDLISLENMKLIPNSVLNADGHKKGKAWTTFAEENAGFILMNDDEWNFCQRMSDAINGEIGPMIHGPRAMREKEIYWTHDGLDLRVKLDALIPMPGGLFPEPWDVPHQLIIDLKTCQSIEPFAWKREVENRKLWLQDAIYSMAVEQLTGQPTRFCFTLVEKDDPPRVRMRELGSQDRELARQDTLNLLSDLKTRIDIDDWSEPGEGIIETIPTLWRKQ